MICGIVFTVALLNALMMNTKKLLASGLTGTSFMTIYSYALSEFRDKNFKEPKVLGQLLKRLIPVIKKRYAHYNGWVLHYIVGIMFAAAYMYLWETKRMMPTIKNGLLLGGISGIIAIVAWKAVLKLHPNPPKLDFKRYYAQLVAAHIVFGAFALIGYKSVGNAGNAVE